MAEDSAAVLDDAMSGEAASTARAELLTEYEFREFYRLHGRDLWGYLYRLTGNAADADDLLQDSFCRLLATPLATRDDGQMRAYLFRVASNTAIDLWRRSGREAKRTEASAVLAPASPADIGHDVALRHDMARTFRELKPQERVLLWLAHVEGTDHRAIAQTLGLKPASVPVLLFRARRKLADLLRRKGLGPGGR